MVSRLVLPRYLLSHLSIMIISFYNTSSLWRLPFANPVIRIEHISSLFNSKLICFVIEYRPVGKPPMFLLWGSHATSSDNAKIIKIFALFNNSSCTGLRPSCCICGNRIRANGVAYCRSDVHGNVVICEGSQELIRGFELAINASNAKIKKIIKAGSFHKRINVIEFYSTFHLKRIETRQLLNPSNVNLNISRLLFLFDETLECRIWYCYFRLTVLNKLRCFQSWCSIMSVHWVDIRRDPI